MAGVPPIRIGLSPGARYVADTVAFVTENARNRLHDHTGDNRGAVTSEIIVTLGSPIKPLRGIRRGREFVFNSDRRKPRSERTEKNVSKFDNRR